MGIFVQKLALGEMVYCVVFCFNAKMYVSATLSAKIHGISCIALLCLGLFVCHASVTAQDPPPVPSLIKVGHLLPRYSFLMLCYMHADNRSKSGYAVRSRSDSGSNSACFIHQFALFFLPTRFEVMCL